MNAEEELQLHNRVWQELEKFTKQVESTLLWPKTQLAIATALQIVAAKRVADANARGTMGMVSRAEMLEWEAVARQAAEAYMPKPKLERRVSCGVSVVITKRIRQPGVHRVLSLMGKRKGSHGAGTWAFPGGWMEHGQSFQETAEREVMEETGLKLTGPVEIVTAISTVFPDRDVHSVTIMLKAPHWEGEPKTMEPDKLDGDWQWFDLDNDPPEPLFEPVKAELLRLRR